MECNVCFASFWNLGSIYNYENVATLAEQLISMLC
uniref:Uncharacterized protein n=1 Tax=Rhizophora mucronata TaxID=61149 RepID=A0A2P2Q4Z6_RHIMU